MHQYKLINLVANVVGECIFGTIYIYIFAPVTYYVKPGIM